MMSVANLLNGLDDAAATEALLRCCGSKGWARRMLARRPFANDEAVFTAADITWAGSPAHEVLEALRHHPEIGADPEKLREKFSATADWAEGEQAGMKEASEETLLALRDANEAYAEKFGHTFVVCATSKTAEEMLGLLQGRLPNDPYTELDIAASEQAKITRLRLAKLEVMLEQQKAEPKAEPKTEEVPG